MSSSSSSSLNNLLFDNRSFAKLPVDDGPRQTSRTIRNAIFTKVDLQPVKNPRLICASLPALNLLGLNLTSFYDVHGNDLVEYLSGSKLIPGSVPCAHVYCGHQFGSFAGQLGDGAAMSLGEIVVNKNNNNNNRTQERWELQLKGAGLTPCSRTADGRKVLRSSIREFLCSEAMFYLNIPTTRAGTVITSDNTVDRDPYYDGDVQAENCTIVSRIAPNFFRFGSFEIFKPSFGGGTRSGPSGGNEDLKKQLLDHVLSYFPTVVEASNNNKDVNVYTLLFREIMERTALLVAQWQCVGFVHGVLNTDNMSVMGLTIDYGPFGFMEHFDPEYTPNGSDNAGRYNYKSQPAICKWNLLKLAEMLGPSLVPMEESAAVMADYDRVFEQHYFSLMSQKLAVPVLNNSSSNNNNSSAVDDKELRLLVEDLFEAMAATSADFTDTFQALTLFVEAWSAVVGDEVKVNSLLLQTNNRILSRCASEEELLLLSQRKLRVHRLDMHPNQLKQLLPLLETNPTQLIGMFGGAPLESIREELLSQQRKLEQFIRTSNNITQLEASIAKKKNSNSNGTCAVDNNNSTRNEHHASVWRAWLNSYLNILNTRYSTTTTTTTTTTTVTKALSRMHEVNPTFVLRNWIAQETIAAATDKEDFSKVHTVLSLLEHPFRPEYSVFYSDSNNNSNSGSKRSSSRSSGNDVSLLQREFLRSPPVWADSVLCTCSS